MQLILSKINKKNYYLVFFIFIFLFPSNSSTMVSGIPFLNKYITLISLTILPFMFLLRTSVFKYNLIKIIIMLIFILKIVLIFSPEKGIGYKQFINENDYSNSNYIKTYSSFWNKDYSAIQKFDWLKKENFPIDWPASSYISLYSDTLDNFDIKSKNIYGGFSNLEEYQSLSLIYFISFYVFLEDSSEIKFVTKGIDKNSYINITKVKSISKKEKTYDKESDFRTSLENFKKLESGIYKIEGKLYFNDYEWSFIPQVKKGSKVNSALREGIVYLDLENNQNINLIKLYDFLTKSLDVTFFVFLISYLSFLYLDIRKKINLPASIGLSLLIFFLSNFLNKFTLAFDGYGSFSLSISLIFLIFLLVILKFKNVILLKNFELYQIKYFLIIICPSFLFFFIIKFYSELEGISWWTSSDDWNIFQSLSRAIVVDGEWLRAGEDILNYRPGIKYFFALIHIMFGQSGFPQKIIEPWLILCSSCLLMLILNKLKVNKFFSFTSAILLLVILLGENYRWIISRGLVAYHSMFMLLLLSYLFIITDLNKIYNLILLSFLGILNIWLREDHIFLTFALIYLNSINSFNLLSKGQNIFILTYRFTIDNFFQILLYGLFLTFGLGIFFLRNYYVGGEFIFSKAAHNISLISGQPLDYFRQFYMLFTASVWPNAPRLTTIFLFGTFLITICKIINLEFTNKINFGLILCVVGCLVPGLVNLFMPAYPPRYTIKYLPYCLIIF